MFGEFHRGIASGKSRGAFLCLLGALAAARMATGAIVAPANPVDRAVVDSADELSEIVVEGHGPRFVAPTRRDSIGRIWAPVFINGKGPFRLVLDTGATQSGLTWEVAQILGLALDQSPPVILRGVTGTATVPTVRVKDLAVGDLLMNAPLMPIIPDAMGGADGILGTAGLDDKRIFIDFRHDRITITYSRGERVRGRFERIDFAHTSDSLIVVNAYVGDVPTKAIIDTGGQLTIANYALRDALRNHWRVGKPDEIIGATKAIQEGEIISTPAIRLGSVQILDTGVTYSNLQIFAHWHLTSKPAILIGMDALGRLDAMVIDYKMHELHLRVPDSGFSNGT